MGCENIFYSLLVHCKITRHERERRTEKTSHRAVQRVHRHGPKRPETLKYSKHISVRNSFVEKLELNYLFTEFDNSEKLMLKSESGSKFHG